MSDRGGLPPFLARLLVRIVPAHRREDVLGDLAETHRARRRRVGAFRARLHLWREALGLVAWWARSWAGRGGAPRPTTKKGRATMGRDLLQDLRFGTRSLARRPGFSLLAVGVLALGIGASATVFSLVDTIFFRAPEHVHEPHRLVRVFRSRGPGENGGSLQNPDYEYYRRGVTTLSGLAAYSGTSTAAYTVSGGSPDQLELAFASDNYFDVLGTTPVLGRGFRPEENRAPGTHPVVVLAHGFWQRGLGGDPAAVGRVITVNGVRFTVVGVAPEGFRGVSPVEAPPDAWAPIAMYGAVARPEDLAWWERLPDLVSSWLQVVGRLAPGSTFAQAEADLTALSESLEHEDREEGEGVFVSRQILYRPSQEATLTRLSRVLGGAVLLVLVIAMANVAVLLLSRASARGREMGVRTALGAGSGRLVRQLLTESLILGVAGGALGVLLAWQLAGVAGALLPFPFLASFRPGPGVLAAATALALVTALLVGCAPALHTVRHDPARALQGARFRASGSGLRHALVVGQVTLSMVLLAGAFLFARSFRAAQGQPLGFATEDRLVVRLDLLGLGYGEEEGRAFVTRALERIRALPGVEGATTTRQIPLRGVWSTDLPRDPEGAPEGETIELLLNTVSPDYFDVAGIPVLRGRGITAEDAGDGAHAMVVNETFARLYWPNEDPLGRVLERGEDAGLRVVGVARDATYAELGEAPRPQAWLSVQQRWQPLVHFLVHTSGDAAQAAPMVHDALRELDPGLAFGWTSSLAAVVEDELARYEVSAILVSAFGLVALLLAAAGLYGVAAFLVSQRTREIGVRMALGADRGRVAGRVLALGLRLGAIGVVLGSIGAVALRGVAEGLLFEVSAADPVPLALAAATLLLVTAGASWGPARRATRVDPLVAMRAE